MTQYKQKVKAAPEQKLLREVTLPVYMCFLKKT